jgi:hypothetical protein
MKTAHIILAHKNPGQLERLILALTHPDSLIFIHIDLKSDIIEFNHLRAFPGVFFVEKRISMHWGGYSQVQAVVNSLTEIVDKSFSILYVNLLSGQDYLLKGAGEFHLFLSLNPGLAFMQYVQDDDLWLKDAATRLSKYHLSDFKFRGKFILERVLNALLPERKLPADFKIIGRSQWFTISIDCVQYILEFIKANKDIVDIFKFSWGADELFFQSILYNSPLKDRLRNDNLRYINWSEGKASPKILSIHDVEQMDISRYFFARKFDEEIEPGVLSYINDNLL